MMNPDSETSPREESGHEILATFARHGLALAPVLQEMLNEHHTHRTERRGAGFTQAGRHLAEHINRARDPYECDEARLFAARRFGKGKELVLLARSLGVSLSWRNLDRQPLPPELSDREVAELFREEADRQRSLRAIVEAMCLEESRVLSALIVDLLLPRTGEAGLTNLSCWPEKLPIGTCPLAEKYFLELADGFVRRGGSMNVIVSRDGVPVMVEKVHLGDDHSCISLEPLVLNGVVLPAGSLLAVKRAPDQAGRPNRALKGQVFAASECLGFRFLRLTTLAISPENRARAFSAHYEAQVAGGLFSPGTATVTQIREVARQQVAP